MIQKLYSFSRLRVISIHTKKDYSSYVDHPRFGRSPVYTGLNVQEGPDISLHLLSPRIPNTAIPTTTAHPNRITQYFDVERKCCNCHRMFIFFAAEQKYWYETLLFPLETDCIRCFPCRRIHQRISRSKREYDKLYHQPNRTIEQSLTKMECCLDLIANKLFSKQKRQWIGMMLNRLPKLLEKSITQQRKKQIINNESCLFKKKQRD